MWGPGASSASLPIREKPSCGVDGKRRDALGLYGHSAIAGSRMRLLDEPGACFGRRGPLVCPAGGLDRRRGSGLVPSPMNLKQCEGLTSDRTNREEGKNG